MKIEDLFRAGFLGKASAFLLQKARFLFLKNSRELVPQRGIGVTTCP